MDRDRDKMVEKILHLTLEILFRLTGEYYTVTSSERCRAPGSEGWGRPLNPTTGVPSHSLIHEDINDQKILELTYKMIELLTGEVPIRCQDVTVYFSMEEWEYVEEHKDLYMENMMEVPQPLTSPVVCSRRTTPERCPRPLLPQNCKQENPNVPQDHQGEDLALKPQGEDPDPDHINTTETYVRGDEWCKEEIISDDYPGISKRYVMSSDFNVVHHVITQDTYEEYVSIPDIPSSLQSEDLSSNPFQQVLSPVSFQKNENNRRDIEHERSPKEESQIAYGICYVDMSNVPKHETSHTEENAFTCLECGKCFTQKSNLFEHQKSHTGEKPFSCSECGKCFTASSKLVLHQRIHTVEKPYSCSECGKCFTKKAYLISHERNHTGEKPFSCSECGTCFNRQSNLIRHEKTHRGEKPFSCSECRNCFIQKSDLVTHQRIHTGEKPFLCSECGQRFSRKYSLFIHQRNHTGVKPHSCLECGKGFSRKSCLIRHQQSHMVEKPYSCL